MIALGRLLQRAAVVLAVHGGLLAASVLLQQLFPDALAGAAGMVAFWMLSLPALLLTEPFTPLYWRVGLMQAPGWFAWPKPAGVALAYAVWIAALWGLGWFVRLRAAPSGR